MQRKLHIYIFYAVSLHNLEKIAKHFSPYLQPIFYRNRKVYKRSFVAMFTWRSVHHYQVKCSSSSSSCLLRNCAVGFLLVAAAVSGVSSKIINNGSNLVRWELGGYRARELGRWSGELHPTFSPPRHRHPTISTAANCSRAAPLLRGQLGEIVPKKVNISND